MKVTPCHASARTAPQAAQRPSMEGAGAPQLEHFVTNVRPYGPA
jgi:hypothetical protein